MKRQRGVEVDHGQIQTRVDKPAEQPVVAVVPLTENRLGAEGDQQTGISDFKADSIEELCQESGIRLSGTYQGSDGSEKSIDIPVQNEMTFTPSGLTLQDPELFQIYITTQVAERIMEMSARDTSGCLTDEQLALIDADVEQLESTLKGDQ